MSYGPPTQAPGGPRPGWQVVTGQPFDRPPTQPNLGRGVVAGFGAGIVSAVIWGGFTGITHYRVGLIAIGVGVLIAWATTKAAGGYCKELGIAAAIITLIACAAGDIGTIYIQAMHETGASLSELMKVRGPLPVLKDDFSSDKLGAVFFLLAAVYAFKYGTNGTTKGYRPRYGTAGKPSQPNPGQQPSYGQPNYGQPNYGQPSSGPSGYPPQPSYGQPTEPAPSDFFGKPVPTQPGAADADSSFAQQQPPAADPSAL